MRTANEIRSEIEKHFHDQEEILKRSTDQKMAGEDEQEFDRLEAALDELEVELQRAEKYEARESHFRKPGEVPPPIRPEEHNSNDPETQERAYAQAFTKWLRFGKEELSDEERKTLRSRPIRDTELAGEVRAQTVTTTGGGYLIPQGFSNELTKALKDYGAVREVARVLQTPSGNTIPWPTYDDTGNTGELLAINTQAAGQDITYGVVNLLAYKYSSKVILVPIELVQDSYFDIDAHIRDVATERLGRITNTHFTTGDNSAKPQGVVAAASLGATAASATAITFDDLLELEHSVDPAYRKNARFMFKDSSLKALKKLKDADGRPIWQTSVAGGPPATIDDYPYVINQDMAAVATGNKSVLFGDFKAYIVRDVMEIMLLRLVERYADYGQIGFLAFSRHDGRGVAGESSFGPIKYLAQP